MALTGTGRGATGSNVAGTSLAMSPTSNYTAGALAVLVVAYDNAGSSGADPYSSISDSHGNTWTARQNALYDPGAASAGATLRFFTSPQNVGTLTTGSTVTVSFGATSVTAKAWAFIEVTAGAGNVAQYGTGAAGTGAATGSPTVTTSSIASGDMVVGGGAAESGDTWTGDADVSNGSWSTKQSAAGGTGTSGQTVIAQYKVTTGTGTQTYNPTLTSADCILAWISLTEAPAYTPVDPMGQMGVFGL